MKRTLKTVISLILCVAMLFSASAIGFSAADEKLGLAIVLAIDCVLAQNNN